MLIFVILIFLDRCVNCSEILSDYKIQNTSVKETRTETYIKLGNCLYLSSILEGFRALASLSSACKKTSPIVERGSIKFVLCLSADSCR